MNLFEKINNWIEAVESSFITLITTLIPWLAPALPAYLTYYHLSEMVHIPRGVSFMMALSVEFLGLSAVSSAFQAMRHNRQKDNRAKARKVSVAFPVGAYIFYLIVVLTVNVVLELPLSEEWHRYMQIVAIALLTLISAPAFIVVISRQQRHEVGTSVKESVRNGTEVVTHDNGYAKMTIQEIMDKEGVSRRTAYRRKQQRHKHIDEIKRIGR